MRYSTLCSGIESPTVAWAPIGWTPVWYSEIETFPCALLRHYYPQVPNLGDMTCIHDHETYKTQPVDIICAGTPCQSFSLAGLRGGMADPRGNLTLHFLRVLAERRPRWVVWENVPDIMSSWTDVEIGKKGQIRQTNDFDTFLAGLRQVGYSVAWRILDAQYFGLAQRRERLFVVGYFGDDWRPPYAVLSDPSCLSGHPAPGRCAGQSVAALTASGVGTCGADDNQARAGHLVVSPPVTSKWAKGVGGYSGDETQNLVVGTLTGCMNDKWGSNQWVDQAHYVISPVADTLTANWHKSGGSCAGTRTGKGLINPVIYRHGIRRLTPLECERLQGFPDNYTRIPYRNKPSENCPAAPRYRAIGNAMPVPVMAWIGRRIDFVNKLITTTARASLRLVQQ